MCARLQARKLMFTSCSAARNGTMGFMLRPLVLAMLVFVVPYAAAGQAVGVLRIKVVLIDAAQNATPVPRHALLISEHPVSAPPRRPFAGTDEL